MNNWTAIYHAFDELLARQFADASWQFLDRREMETIAIAQACIPMPAKLSKAVDKRRIDFVMGRYAAALALAKLGVTAGDIPINPDFSPKWPPGITGSISHNQDLVVAIVVPQASCRSLGIDVEMLLSKDQGDEIKRQITSEQEFLVLQQSLVGWTESQILTLAFSAKESLYKCLRPLVGRFFDFGEAQLHIVSQERGEFRLRLVGDLSPDFAAGLQLTGYWAISGHCMLTALRL